MLEQYGWLIALAVLGVAGWIAALVLIIRSPKFRRKWLWALLILVNFSFGRQIAPGLEINASIPLGALYVLGFWRWGPAPVGPPPPRSSGDASAVTTPARLRLLRIGYGLGVLCGLGLALLGVSGMLTTLVLQAGPTTDLPPDAASMIRLLDYMNAAVGLILAGVFGVLARRPYGWGKLLCGAAGLSWLGFALVFLLVAPELGGSLPLLIGIAGALMLATAVTHQLVDPRLTASAVTA